MTEIDKEEIVEGNDRIPDQETAAAADEERDEFAEDVEKLRQMKKQQMEKLQEAKQMVERLERSITKIDGQLEFIQYRRNKSDEEQVE